jgi:RNA recognition motif-containing protein
MRIYVGNLAHETSEEQLRAMFSPHGEVRAARLPKDKETGAPRGFGIVEMDDERAQVAIDAMRGVSMGGRALRVKEAKPRPAKPGDGSAVT